VVSKIYLLAYISLTDPIHFVGAGKTTLVEILAGKSKSGRVTGHVTFPSSSNSPPSIGFVPQQDILPPTLTVFEALLFAARLRLPENISDDDKKARVEGIMTKLGIAALRDVRIGYEGGGGGGRGRGISGGEMRRVSIGLELIAKPDVLILDEPTSGQLPSQTK
jgi:ABC-type multidrug transport system ATPase subunit